jgi:hypothetical protein
VDPFPKRRPILISSNRRILRYSDPGTTKLDILGFCIAGRPLGSQLVSSLALAFSDFAGLLAWFNNGLLASGALKEGAILMVAVGGRVLCGMVEIYVGGGCLWISGDVGEGKDGRIT